MRMNPILKKELVLGARNIKLSVALMFYSGILSITALAILSGITSSYNYGNSMNFETLTAIFLVLAFMQMVMVCIIIPIMTAGSIAGEREKQTLDIMLTAPVTPFRIVRGKLMSAMSNIFLFVISSLPAMAIAFLYGGIHWQYLLVFLVAIMSIALFCGSIGIWCSAVYKRTIIAVIMTLVWELIFFLGTLVFFLGIYYWKYYQLVEAGSYDISKIYIGWLPMLLFLNPASGFVDAIYQTYSGVNLIDYILTNGTFGTVSTQFARLCPYWSWISLVCTIVMSFIFMKLAARRIDAVRRKEKHMKVKKPKKKQGSQEE